MKKIFLILGIPALIVAIIIVLMLGIKPILKWSVNSLLNFVVAQLDEAEKERQRRVANGEIVRGRDTILIWENMYVIAHYHDGNCLTMDKDGTINAVLEKVENHKVKKDKLYVLSEEGYAIIDKSNICRVLVTVPEEDFFNGYSIDDEGVKHPISRFLNDENVLYLSSYDDFTEEEKAIFEKMERKKS